MKLSAIALLALTSGIAAAPAPKAGKDVDRHDYKPPKDHYKPPADYKPPKDHYKPPSEYKPPPKDYHKPPKDHYKPPSEHKP
ncbi:unnamed protein product, partial [Fusarium graminearum]